VTMEVTGERRAPGILSLAGQIVAGEVLTQAIEQEGYVGSPIYQTALEQAETVVYGANVLRRLRAEMDPTEEEIAQFLENNRDEIAPAMVLEVWQIEIRPRSGEDVVFESDLPALRMRRLMETTIERAQQQLSERADI